MSERPVEAREADAPADVPLYPAFDYPYYIPPAPRSRVVVKQDLLPAISVVSLVSLLGIPLAYLWSLLAPSQLKAVSRSGQLVPLTAESYHRFDSMAVFVALSLGAGLVVGVSVWFMRERRGPVAMVAVVLGSLLAAYLATLMTGLFTGWLYDVPTALNVGDVVDVAPTIESTWVILAQPLAAALAYGVLAAWNGLDDLGRRLG
ncbi:xanthosine utilization system XapX-like protein [Kibdelosporangium banguiense]|uniref:Xanthosine utilization system XapX-like protein n=1 Tax=Kibdelosporangium banguiense TaxID=1365924 RepID=A0ABS4TJL8_9PSEU|nr:DUF2567 domain-containing protein [Kibdelosporangium banguiense]MBP2324056.1 xanthosine utilization system XapX-like protein [Kibdelosporangium banguiense]